MKPRFQFGQIVVVDDDQIGVIVKTWLNSTMRKPGYHYKVYVRSLNLVSEYREGEIDHFVYSKELTEEEKEFY